MQDKRPQVFAIHDTVRYSKEYLQKHPEDRRLYGGHGEIVGFARSLLDINGKAEHLAVIRWNNGNVREEYICNLILIENV